MQLPHSTLGITGLLNALVLQTLHLQPQLPQLLLLPAAGKPAPQFLSATTVDALSALRTTQL